MQGSRARPAMLAAAFLAAMAAAHARGVVAADGLRGTAAVTTDYVHRGLSQSDGRSALQGSITWWHPAGGYAGAWVSTLRSANSYVYPAAAGSSGANLEADLFAGIGRPVGADWTIDVKAAAYLYPDDPAPVDYDYVELSFGAAWRQQLFATLAVAPRTAWIARAGGGREHTAVDVALGWQHPLSSWFTLMAGVGRRELMAPGRSAYVYGSTAVALQTRRVDVELAWFTTDGDGRWLFGDRVAGRRAALTATVSF